MALRVHWLFCPVLRADRHYFDYSCFNWVGNKGYTNKMKYELYYNTGGHCGPYPNFKEAEKAAKDKLNGCKLMTSIEIRNTNSTFRGGFNGANHGSFFSK